MTTTQLIAESNRIEGITRRPERYELDAFHWFIGLDEVSVKDLESFVTSCEPGAVLRDKPGLDVRIGNHHPPPGGPEIRKDLENLLRRVNLLVGTSNNLMSPHVYQDHIDYETLHPFKGGNGCSGRMLWYWVMRDEPRAQELGFLHCWYCQSLEHGREGK